MNRVITQRLIGILLITGISVPAIATAGDDRMRGWQLSLLFEPGEQQVRMEKKGRVMIYDGMHTADIQRAMDEEFDRVENMMFTNTIVTDPAGKPMTDPQTGLVMVEEEGCE